MAVGHSYLNWFSSGGAAPQSTTPKQPAVASQNTGGRVSAGTQESLNRMDNAANLEWITSDRYKAQNAAASARANNPTNIGPGGYDSGGLEGLFARMGTGMQGGQVVSHTPTRTPAMIQADRQREKWATEDRSTQQKLIDDLMGSQAESREAGETRYQELMDLMSRLTGQVGGTYDAALGEMEGMGTAGRTRIGEGRTRALAESEQDLMSRGLGNTTIRSSVRRGVKSDYERQLQELNERVSGQRSGLLQQRAGAEMDLGRLGIDTRLSRQDVGPDVSQYLSLIQMLGQSQ